MHATESRLTWSQFNAIVTQPSGHYGTIIFHEFSCNAAWMVLLTESVASLLYKKLSGTPWPSQFSMHVCRWFLTLYSQMRWGGHVLHSAIFNNIHLWLTCTFVGAKSVSLMSPRQPCSLRAPDYKYKLCTYQLFAPLTPPGAKMGEW